MNPPYPRIWIWSLFCGARWHSLRRKGEKTSSFYKSFSNSLLTYLRTYSIILDFGFWILDLTLDFGISQKMDQNQPISPCNGETPFRRAWVSWRVVSSIGELRGCTISGNRQHAG
jgi:hypothetical protein